MWKMTAYISHKEVQMIRENNQRLQLVGLIIATVIICHLCMHVKVYWHTIQKCTARIRMRAVIHTFFLTSTKD